MSGVALLGDVCTGHGCWPSRPNDQASTDVFVNSKGVHRVGDHWAKHKCGSEHDSTLAVGSSTVFVNSKPVGRIGDRIQCGSFIKTGSSDVIVGG